MWDQASEKIIGGEEEIAAAGLVFSENVPIRGMSRKGRRGMNILVVDDSLVMRMIIEKGLRHAGVAGRITHAANGLDGLGKIEQMERKGEAFGLILTDIHMPLMGGPELITEIRGRGLAKGVPILLITADDGAAADVSAIADLGVARLTKPFTLDQMQGALAPLLGEVAHG